MTGARAADSVAFHGRAAYLTAADALVVADLHVGRDEASAVSLPLGETADLRERLATAVSRFDPDTVVVAGDVVHTFDGVTAHTRESLDALVEACERADAEVVLVAGNHDTALSAAWDGPVYDEYVFDSEDGHESAADEPSRTVVCHGHEPPEREADRYVFGHVHPAVEIHGDRRPCFLYGEGTYRDGDILCLPAFTQLAPGVSVNDRRASDFDTPLVNDANRLQPIVYDADAGEPLWFPPLGEFRQML